MILFFVADLNTSNPLLEEDEFQHCCKVLRHKEGDTIHVTNGRGIFGTATITKVKKRSALLDVTTHEEFKKNQRQVVLAVAPPKNRSRWEWLVEKAVEIGVDTIIPMTSNHSERVKLNIERSRKIMRSAALQSKRKWHPTMAEITSFDAILNDDAFANHNKLIAHFSPNNQHIKSLKNDGKSTLVLVGPEGDFSHEEIEKSKANSFTLVNISDNRLRTETAAIVSVNFIV